MTSAQDEDEILEILTEEDLDRAWEVGHVPGGSSLTPYQWELLYHEYETEVSTAREISIDHCTQQEWEEFLRYLEERLDA